MNYKNLYKDIVTVLIGEQGLPNLPKSMKDAGDDDTPKKPKALEPSSEPKAEKPAPKAEPKPEPKPEPKAEPKADTTYSDNIDTTVNVPKDRGLIPKDTIPRETGEVRLKPPSDMKITPKVIDIPTVNRGGYNKEFNPGKYKRNI